MTSQGPVLNLQPICRLNDRINLQMPCIIINCSLIGVPCVFKNKTEISSDKSYSKNRRCIVRRLILVCPGYSGLSVCNVVLISLKY